MRKKFNPGDRFGRLVIVEKTERRQGSHAMYLCKCDCGGTKTVQSANLTNGNTRSCGCLATETNLRRLTTHGGTHTRLYSIWHGVIQRCENKNAPAYPLYGGRGISVCQEWKNFAVFRKDMSDGYDDSLELDRIDNDGNYTKENCRWATKREQCRNRRNNRLVTFRGKTKTLVAWAEELGLKYTTLYYRIHFAGWSVEEALESPMLKSRRRLKKYSAKKPGFIKKRPTQLSALCS